MKWEHAVLKATSRDEMNEALNFYSDGGWELVAVSTLQGTEKQRVGAGSATSFIDVQWFQWDLFFKRPAA